MSSGAVALLGPNGAGKTTLFRVLSTTLAPTTGTFVISGETGTDRTGREHLSKRFGYLPQDFRAFGGCTCQELVAHVASGRPTAGVRVNRTRRWWWLARGWQVPTLLVGWAVLLIANLFGPAVVVLSAVAVSGKVPTPSVFLLGGLLGILAVLLAAEPCPSVFVTAPSRARWVNLTRVAAASLAGPLLLTALGGGDPLATTSTTVVVAGEGLLAASVLGLRLAWLPPLIHLAPAGSFGAATPDTLRPWAWLSSRR